MYCQNLNVYFGIFDKMIEFALLITDEPTLLPIC